MRLFWLKVLVHRLLRYLAWAWEDAVCAIVGGAGTARPTRAGPAHGRRPAAQLAGLHLLFRHCSPVVRDPRRALEEFQANKEHNLKLACAKIDGIVVRPGEVFSFCRAVGPTTESRGYLPALTLAGSSLVTMAGGGLCQFSNMVFWMALHLGFEIVERHRHSFDLFPDMGRTIPFGCGATVFYNYVDLRVRNTLEFPVAFRFRVSDGVLIGDALGPRPLPFRVSVYETDHSFYEVGGRVRRRNRVWRRIDYAGPGVPELVCENDCIVRYAIDPT